MSLQGDYLLTILIINPINLRLVCFIGKTSITPNQLSLCSFVMTVVSAVCMTSVNQSVQAAGGVLLMFGFLVDCMDGDLARFKNLKTPLGAMQDPVFDRIGEAAVMGGAAVGGWRTTGDPIWLVGGILLVGSSQVYFYITDTMLNKVQKPGGKTDVSRSFTIHGTRVRFGVIEPFVWGQAFFCFSGNAHWGVAVFGAMFSACSIIQLYRLVAFARSLKGTASNEYSPHVEKI
jgi:phosphatidylglycerophosphate synthase